MPMATIHKVGQGSDLYHIHFLDGATHPDQGLPGSGARPDNSLPGYGHPDQGLPGRPPRPDQGLPGHQPHPGQELPVIPGVPDNSLPETPPPQVAPGKALVMVRSADGKWRWAAIDASVHPTPLPEVPAPTPHA